MKTEKVSVERLVLDPENARKHSKKNLEAIEASLEKFGQQKPIVVSKDDIVIAGNGTLVAARILGWDEISIVRTNLDSAKIKAFAIADNKIAELSEWDYEVLVELINELEASDFDVDATGFSIEDIEKIDGITWDKGTPDDDILKQLTDEMYKKNIILRGDEVILYEDATQQIRDTYGCTCSEAFIKICEKLIEKYENEDMSI